MTIDIRRLTRLTIGINTESGVEEYEFDLFPWQNEHPGLHTFQLNVTPPGGMPYKAETHMDGYVLVWPITASDTALPGDDGWYEIEAFGDDGLHKLSPKRSLAVMERMVGDLGDAPQTIQNWVEEANEALEDNRAATLAAQESAAAAWKAAEEAEKATDAAEAVIKGAVVRNLLDNSDFRNPINQRGFTSTNKDAVFTVDRWYSNSGDNAATISLGSGGITLAPTATYDAGIYQRFENYDTMSGKVYTIGVCINETWETAKFTMNNAAGGYVLPCGIKVYSTDGFHVLIRNPAGNSPITIQRVALYEGSYTADTLPAYQPKGYAAELMECKRYFQKVTARAIVPYYVSKDMRAYSFMLETEMRTVPTITLPEKIEYNDGSWGATGAEIAVSATSNILVTVTASGAIAEGTRPHATVSYEASADL